MPALREILQRFRAAGPPGPAVPAAVPVDRRAGLLDETAPLFAALAPATAEARRLVAEAAAEAERLRSAADQEARVLVDDAEDDRSGEYATALAQARTAAAEEAGAGIEQARSEARRIAARAAARMPELAERAVCDLRRSLADAGFEVP